MSNNVENTVSAGAADEINVAELDRESRTRSLPGWQGTAITVILVCFTAFQLYASIFNTIPAQLLRMSHLAFSFR